MAGDVDKDILGVSVLLVIFSTVQYLWSVTVGMGFCRLAYIGIVLIR